MGDCSYSNHTNVHCKKWACEMGDMLMTLTSSYHSVYAVCHPQCWENTNVCWLYLINLGLGRRETTPASTLEPPDCEKGILSFKPPSLRRYIMAALTKWPYNPKLEWCHIVLCLSSMSSVSSSVLARVLSTWHNPVSFRKRDSQWRKIPPWDWPVVHFLD